MTIAIIDYGSGNLRSVANAFERVTIKEELNRAVEVTADPDRVAGADHIMLPGVGAFGDCARGLRALPGMIDALEEAVLGKGRPFLGVCVGMQLMATRGLEHGEHAGLGWLDGDVVHIEPSDPALKVPHMGWNTLDMHRDHPVLDGIATGDHAYFVHSYHLAATDEADVLATTDHGQTLTAIVGRANMIGTQFHPEKSQATGLRLIANFFAVAAMILYPAIDLKQGRCVRLFKGDMDQATIFNDDPADQAHRFQDQGFAWLHLVDLDGAFAGAPVNADAVQAILADITIPAQLGGGMRDLATVERWLSAGITRVILGTVAVRDPDLVRQACKMFPGQVALGIDAKDGMVAVEGWAETSTLGALDLAQRFEDAGAAAIIYTDIDRDGALTGVNVAATLALADAVSTPVIASGGVAGMADLEALKRAAHPNMDGVISGRALYDGRIDVLDALALLEAPC